jgi:hypothetical protein
LGQAAGEFVRGAEGRADYQYFFGGRTCFQPIPTAGDPVMTSGRCDNGKPHLGELTASWARRQLSRSHRVAANNNDIGVPFVDFGVVKTSDIGAFKRRQFLLMRSSGGRNTVTLSISNAEPQDPERLILPTTSVD